MFPILRREQDRLRQLSPYERYDQRNDTWLAYTQKPTVENLYTAIITETFAHLYGMKEISLSEKIIDVTLTGSELSDILREP